MAAAIQNGQRVVCVTATKGEAGVQDENRWPTARLGEIRAREMQAALKVLGISEHHWLGYKDGACNTISDEEGAGRIKAFIKSVKPDTILTFGPDGMTGHTDHQSVSRWVGRAAEAGDAVVYHCVETEENYESYLKEADEKFNIYFNIDKPPLCDKKDCDIAFCLTRELLQKKCRALKAMPSQTEGMFNVMPQEFFGAALACECYLRARHIA